MKIIEQIPTYPKEQIDRLQAEVRCLQAEVQRLRVALTFYADEANWSREVGDEWWDVWEPSSDGFAPARLALKDREEETP